MFAWIRRLLNGTPPPKAPKAAAPTPAARPHALHVRLPADRRFEGKAEIRDADGHVLVSGWAIGAAWRDLARAAGNPDADPLLPFGDVPAGRYALARVATDAEMADIPVGEDIGRIRPILFAALDGPGLRAQAAGRTRLALHAGRRGPACGTLRIEEKVMKIAANLTEGAVLTIEDEIRDLHSSTATPQTSDTPASQPRSAALVAARPLPPMPTGARPTKASSYTTSPPQDPMDGFLFAYLTGVPLQVTPGSILGMVLHQQDTARRHADLAAQQGLANLGLAPVFSPSAKSDFTTGGVLPAEGTFKTGGAIEGQAFATGGTMDAYQSDNTPKDTGDIKAEWPTKPLGDETFAEPVSFAGSTGPDRTAPTDSDQASGDTKAEWPTKTFDVAPAAEPAAFSTDAPSDSGPDLDAQGGYGR